MSNSEYVKHADDNNFSTLVLKEEKPTLVDFWAPGAVPAGQSVRFSRNLRLSITNGSTS